MTLPTTNFSISEIKTELGIPSQYVNSIRELFQYGGIRKAGLNSTYCPGSSEDDRLSNLRSIPYSIGKWRGYNHSVTPPTFPSFSVSSDILLYNEYNFYKFNPDVDSQPIDLGVAAGGIGGASGWNSIALSNNKLYKTNNSNNEINIYNVTYSPNFTASFSETKAMDGENGENLYVGITYLNSYILKVGYRVSSTNYISNVDPSLTPPLGFWVDTFTFGNGYSILGDICWDTNTNHHYYVKYSQNPNWPEDIGERNYGLYKIDSLTNSIQAVSVLSEGMGMLFFGASGTLYLLDSSKLYSVNTTTLGRSYIKDINDLGWRGSSQVLYP
jgi:hypothetical protein